MALSTATRQIPRGAVTPDRLAIALLNRRYCLETFMEEPISYEKASLTEPTSTSLNENLVFTGRYTFEYYPISAATDVVRPAFASEGGYNWGGSSDVVGAGFELNFGGLKDGHPRNFVPGNTTTGAGDDWFARILLILDDASGADVFFGFRKVAATLATLTEYSDVVGWRILGNSASTDASFTLITNLNNAGATDYTSTTPVPNPTGLEDATIVELEVQSVGRAAAWYLNGAKYVGATYTFDTADVMAPVLRMLQATDIAAQIKTLAYEAGPLDYRQAGTLASLAGTTT